MRMQVRLIDSGHLSPSMNMAIDEALTTSTDPVLRFYAWKPRALSIGYFQNTQLINKERCKELNIPIVRRPTGGNAVLHDQEITYAFIIDEDKMPSDVTESYREISKGLLEGLKVLGLSPEMNQDVNNDEKSAVCFNDPSWYELLVNNKKIIGSAQKRIKGKILQHGAILLNADPALYCSLFTNCTDHLINKVKERMTSVDQERNKETSYNDAKQAFQSGFQKALNINLKNDDLTDREKELANQLNTEKYDNSEWTYKR